MFDLTELESYKEGNRLEVKKALGRDGQGELPRSVWETVSVFANTSGGVIALGVTERKDDGSFFVHGIPMAGKVLDDFWNAALSEDKVSTRFMKDSDATVETVDGKDIVVIRVPWVDRFTRPVYIDNKIFGGWEWAGYGEPSYDVAFGPDRTTLTLPLVSADSTGEDRQKSAEIGRNGDGSAKSAIIAHLSQFGPTKRAELESVTGLGTSRVNDLLRDLIADGVVVAEGATRSRRYRLAE